MMHGYEQSDPVIVAMKPTNKAGQPVAEPVEPRACPWLEQGAGAEGTAGRQSTLRAQNRKRVTQALDRVRQAAKERRRNGSPRSSTISASTCCGWRSSPSSETPRPG